jgi:hypothetical protein
LSSTIIMMRIGRRRIGRRRIGRQRRTGQLLIVRLPSGMTIIATRSLTKDAPGVGT